MRSAFRLGPGQNAAWLLLAVTPLLCGGCGPRLPLQQAEILQHFEHRLLAEEAHVYLPEETGRLRSEIQTALRLENFVPARVLLKPSSSLDEKIEFQIWQAQHLLVELSSLRERLQQEQETVMDFLQAHLTEHRGYRDFPELARLAGQIEQKMAEVRDFCSPGAYRHNLSLMHQIGELFGQLQARWLRYNGGPLSVEQIEPELALYRERLESLQPSGRFIVIDTSLNRLHVKEGDRILLDALCSTGSGHKLATADQEWEFDTPRGEFVVRQKLEDPVWWKPDWAFIEAGEPIPRRKEDRIEPGAMGKYALEFGDGYFIHGTLYTRLLGQAVTHGCVRVGEDDLKQLTELVPVGAKILIF